MADQLRFLALNEVASQNVTLHRGARVQGVVGLRLAVIVDEGDIVENPETIEVLRYPNDTDVTLGTPDVEADYKYIGADSGAVWYIQHDNLTP